MAAAAAVQNRHITTIFTTLQAISLEYETKTTTDESCFFNIGLFIIINNNRRRRGGLSICIISEALEYHHYHQQHESCCPINTEIRSERDVPSHDEIPTSSVYHRYHLATCPRQRHDGCGFTKWRHFDGRIDEGLATRHEGTPSDCLFCSIVVVVQDCFIYNSPYHSHSSLDRIGESTKQTES